MMSGREREGGGGKRKKERDKMGKIKETDRQTD